MGVFNGPPIPLFHCAGSVPGLNFGTSAALFYKKIIGAGALK